MNPRGFRNTSFGAVTGNCTQPIALRIHNSHRVAVIAGHVQPRTAAVEDHLVRCPAHGDARDDVRCLVRRLPQRHYHDLSVANAGDIGLVIAFNRHPEWIFAARRALFAASLFPGLRSSSAIFARDPRSTTLIESFS